MKREYGNKNRLKIAIALGCAMLCFSPYVTSAQTEKEDGKATVSVSSECSVKVTPDIASLSVSITTEDEDAADAQTANTQQVNALIEVLAQAGIAAEKIKTTGYDMYPRYDYESYQKIVGYTVITSLTISDQKIETVGDIVDVCVSQGVNGIDGIRYSCSDYDAAYKEALTKAVEEARATAETIAEASGKTLGEIAEIAEGSQDTSLRYENTAESKLMTMASQEDAADTGLSVMPGEAEITASISASWYLE